MPDVRRLVIELEKADHKRVKLAAVNHEVTIRDLIVEMLWRQGIVEERPPKLALGSAESREGVAEPAA